MLAIFEPAFSVSIWVRNLPSAIDPGGAQRPCSVVFNLRTELNYAGGSRDAALTPAKFVWGVLNVRDPQRLDKGVVAAGPEEEKRQEWESHAKKATEIAGKEREREKFGGERRERQ
ncbi:unnamed protein product [Sphagnum jensenii]|uniref:Uncharacterized protein n=1 Tax=Sphagnum jensenii TaxID=128206 RepID=A0ABP0VHL7_9BRYO